MYFISFFLFVKENNFSTLFFKETMLEYNCKLEVKIKQILSTQLYSSFHIIALYIFTQLKPYLHNTNRKRYKLMKIRFYIYSNLTGFRASSMLHYYILHFNFLINNVIDIVTIL